MFHVLAASVGVWLAQLIAPQWLPWITGVIFIIFGLWVLRSDALDDGPKLHQAGVFVTAIIVFFIAEVADKTQLATIAPGAPLQQALLAVVMATTLGMMIANVPAVFTGERLAEHLPLEAIRWIAARAFML